MNPEGDTQQIMEQLQADVDAFKEYAIKVDALLRSCTDAIPPKPTEKP